MSTNDEKIKLRLRYWNIRGRPQAFRYMLEEIAYQHKNVDYEEEFEPIDTMFTTWSQRKYDPTVSGPYRVLPVLHWNEKEIFGQTLTIAHLLARKFDLYGKPTSKYSDPVLLESYLNAVATGAYTDIIGNALLCLWSNPSFESENNPDAYTLERIRDAIDALNVLLKQSSTSFFYDQNEPTIADYFAFEAFTVSRDIHKKLLPKNCDALEKLEKLIKQRPAIRNYFESGRFFKRYTAAPQEDEYLEKISKIK